MQKVETNDFLPQTILGHDAYHNNRTQTKPQIDMKKWAVAVVDLTTFEGCYGKTSNSMTLNLYFKRTIDDG